MIEEDCGGTMIVHCVVGYLPLVLDRVNLMIQDKGHSPAPLRDSIKLPFKE